MAETIYRIRLITPLGGVSGSDVAEVFLKKLVVAMIVMEFRVVCLNEHNN